ncbi:Ger(x)C family spore germination protein [Paenibacillus alkalitolerans]|uniref:Ger(x)C family spore germination protein n=1 Tax=Paenibacillus alkalitolerans TaxID=2799335 RepID=UPI0018F4FE65|nr:Ger(x)C family spore germination protein [Paenibacillus alkalitolerans]
MKRKAGLLGLLFIAMFLLAGCWNYRELNELSMALAMGVDKAPRGEFRVTFQIVNANEVAGQRATGRTVPITVYSSTGKTMFEAIRKASLLVPRRINVQHMRDFVIGERLAREGLKEVFDLMERDHEMRMTTRVFIARGAEAETILKALTSLEGIPANAILGKLKVTGRALGESYEVEIDDAIRGLQRKGGGPVISGIKLVGDRPAAENKSNVEETELKAKLQIAGMALIKEGKLAGWIDNGPARGVSWITNNMQSSIVVLDCDKKKGKIAIEIVRSMTKLEAKVQGKRPLIRIHIKQIGNVGEALCAVDLNKSAEILKLQRQWNKATKKDVMAAVKAAQKLKTDVFGFGEAVEREGPKAWKKMEKDWGRIFAECGVEVNVESIIRRTGMRTSPFFKEKK